MTAPLHQILPAWTAGLPSDDLIIPPGGLPEDEGIWVQETVPLYDPETHAGPERLSDVGGLFDRLRPRDGAIPDGEPPVGQNEEEKSADSGRIERLAWYRTFRRPARWGIYIREAGILRVASALGDINPETVRAAGCFLYLHEYAHFLIDVSVRALEQALDCGLYESRRRAIHGTPPGWDPVEEALCNAFGYRVAPRGKKVLLRRYLRRGPEGYKNFEAFGPTPSFYDALDSVFGGFLHGRDDAPAVGTGILFGEPHLGRPDVTASMVPVRLVLDRAPQGAQAGGRDFFALITRLGTISVTRQFERSLDKLPANIKRLWHESLLPTLRTDVAAAPTFGRLKSQHDLWHVRLGRSYRVIIRKVGNDTWRVEDVEHRSKDYRNLRRL